MKNYFNIIFVIIYSIGIKSYPRVNEKLCNFRSRCFIYKWRKLGRRRNEKHRKRQNEVILENYNIAKESISFLCGGFLRILGRTYYRKFILLKGVQ